MRRRGRGVTGSVAVLALLATGCVSGQGDVTVGEAPPTDATSPADDPEPAPGVETSGSAHQRVLDAEALGACVDPDHWRVEQDRVLGPSFRWWIIKHWRRLETELILGEAAAAPTDDEPNPTARLDPVTTGTSGGDVQPSLLLSQVNADRVLDAQDTDADLYVAIVGTDDDGGEYVDLVVAVAGDDIAVVGDCGYDPHTRALARFAASRDQTPAATFLGLMQGAIEIDEYEAWGPGPEETWDAPSYEHLETAPLLDSSGALRDEIVMVDGPTPDYIMSHVDSLEEMVELADAVVVARTSAREQFWSEPSDVPRASRVRTRQSFEIVQVIAGDVEDTVDVIFMGGAVGDRLVEPDGEPQYRAERDYLLFLHETPSGVDGYWTVGPAAGRYLLDQGRIVASYEADRHGDWRVGSYDDLFADMLGRDLDDLAEEIDALWP